MKSRTRSNDCVFGACSDTRRTIQRSIRSRFPNTFSGASASAPSRCSSALMCALKSALKRSARTSSRTYGAIATLSSPSANANCSSRRTSNLTGFFGSFFILDSFSSFGASAAPDADATAAGGAAPAAPFDARTAPPRAVVGRVGADLIGDTDGDGFSDGFRELGAEEPTTMPPFSTCATTAFFNAPGASESLQSADVSFDPTRLITSSRSFPPAVRAAVALSPRPTEASTTTELRSTSFPASAARAFNDQTNASDLPSPLIFPDASSIVVATYGKVLFKPAADAHESSAPAAAVRTEDLLSPNCFVMSLTRPWP